MAFPYKVVVITGASTGLGEAMARQLVAQGCKAALIARSADKLHALAAELGNNALAVPCNVDDWAAMQAAVAHIEEALGPIECMIANAGIGGVMTPGVWDPDAAERIIQTNYLGLIYSLYAVLPGMHKRGRGHLVGVASMASYQGVPADAGYSASKAAARLFLESLRVELHGSGVKVTTICPGFVRTPLTDKNDFDMIMLLEPAAAARRMLRAIACGRREYGFPWRLTVLVWIGLHTPRWIFDRALGMATRMAKKRTQALSDGSKP